MHYEEELINGRLMYRLSPEGKWAQCDVEKVSQRLVKAEETIKDMEKRWKDVVNDAREQAYINGKHYEKDRIKELLGLGS